MWPLIKAVKRSRNYLRSTLSRALQITGAILGQKRLTEVPIRSIDSMTEGRIVPYFYPVMPRDQQAIVDEVVKLLSCKPPAISMETAQKILGRGTGEVERIKAMIADEELFARENQEMQMKQDLAEQQLQNKSEMADKQMAFKQEEGDKSRALDAEKAKTAKKE
jgi:hypothetical protein